MTRNLVRVATAAVLFALVASIGACGTTYIGSTTIPDTEENREVYQMVMDYRAAMEKRDAEAIAAMLSRSYFENAATTHRSDDDYGYDRVRDQLLQELRDNVLAVQLRIMMRQIAIDGDRAYADYEFYYTFKYTEGGVEGWEPKNDFNRLEFVREDGMWKIAGGL